mmetsp:Transcript_11993/g.33741  ORF Transcript_11993/g.33741 Transcript_11993/m.33741 type:complete len:230 (-) Transcript_11993:1727-2416(-)
MSKRWISASASANAPAGASRGGGSARLPPLPPAPTPAEAEAAVASARASARREPLLSRISERWRSSSKADCCALPSCCNNALICSSYFLVTIPMALVELESCLFNTVSSSATRLAFSSIWASFAASRLPACFSRCRRRIIFSQHPSSTALASSRVTPENSASNKAAAPPPPPLPGRISCWAFAMRASRKSISSCKASILSSISRSMFSARCRSSGGWACAVSDMFLAAI